MTSEKRAEAGNTSNEPRQKASIDTWLKEARKDVNYRPSNELLHTLDAADLAYLEKQLDGERNLTDNSEAEAFVNSTSLGLKQRILALLHGGKNRYLGKMHAQNKESDARRAALEGVYPDHDVEYQRDEKILAALLENGTDEREVEFLFHAGNGDAVPSRAGWGVIVVDEKKSINDNIAFVKAHLDEAQRLQVEIKKELEAAEEVINAPLKSFKFSLGKITSGVVADSIEGGGLISVEEMIARATTLAEKIAVDEERFSSEALKGEVHTISPSWDQEYCDFCHSGYTLILDFKKSDDELLNTLEKVMKTSDPSEAAKVLPTMFHDSVRSESLTDFEITKICIANGFRDNRYLVKLGEQFTEPNEEGYFTVKLGATAEEIERHIEANMAGAEANREAAFRRKFPAYRGPEDYLEGEV